MEETAKPPLQRYEQYQLSMKRMIYNNFIGGIAWGIGATLGLSVVLAVLGFVMGQINLIPYVGSFISDIYNFVAETNPNLKN